MTPNRRARIEAVLNALDTNPTAECFKACGGRIDTAAITNTARFAGVTATCTWDDGEPLVAAWVRMARRKLALADFREGR